VDAFLIKPLRPGDGGGGGDENHYIDPTYNFGMTPIEMRRRKIEAWKNLGDEGRYNVAFVHLKSLQTHGALPFLRALQNCYGLKPLRSAYEDITEHVVLNTIQRERENPVTFRLEKSAEIILHAEKTPEERFVNSLKEKSLLFVQGKKLPKVQFWPNSELLERPVVSFEQQQVAISLGWNCSPAMWGVEKGLRLRKVDGYKTCPFDEMMSNFPGLLACLESNFHDFCNPAFLEVHHVPDGLPYVDYNDYCTDIIINTRYRFIFNHESPGHPFLPKKQNWPGGNNHFVENNFEAFIQRYHQRIENFRAYIHTPGIQVTFLLSRPNYTDEDQKKLERVLHTAFPAFQFIIRIVDTDALLHHNALRLMGFEEMDPEVLKTDVRSR
jgi:hypothetical protein